MAGNRYDSLATPLGTLESQANIESYVVFHVISHACFICFSFSDLFVAYFIYVSIIVLSFIILLCE